MAAQCKFLNSNPVKGGTIDGVLMIRALLFESKIRAPDFWKLLM